MAEQILTRADILHELFGLTWIAAHMQPTEPTYAETHAEINELLEDLAALDRLTR